MMGRAVGLARRGLSFVEMLTCAFHILAKMW